MEGRVMGIYIKGFIPTDGLYQIKDGVIRKYKGNGGTVRPYELVEVKEPHGRLIDADALYETLCHIWDRSDSEEFEQAVFESIANAPTVEVPTWIPCSERLPEYRKLVDVTTRGLRVKLAYLDSIEEDGTDDLWIIPLEDAECALWNVVAWKPRPDPWKGDK